MKQLLQNLGSGETLLADIPCPQVGRGNLLIRSSASLISIGTERMLIDFGKANIIDKARQQPEKVRQVLSKVKTDGLFPTLEAVRAKLDQPLALGYSNAGIVLEVGSSVEGFAVGDRVISNGPHAEVVSIPQNLCARIPEGVSMESAAFTVVSSIGLQGIRLIAPTLGERIVVTGLGLIGLLCVQMLKAQGCQVLGFDFDPARCELARQMGATAVVIGSGADPVSAGMTFSQGRGVDAVLITAATKSSEPMQQAAQMSRKRGRIVLVGVAGLELNRSDFYEKELTFQVSCSYGPGRYEEAYELHGHDYPLGFVRWTEQRNFEAVIDLMASGQLNVAPLLTHRFSFDKALEAYQCVNEKKALGILLEYPEQEVSLLRNSSLPVVSAQAKGTPPAVSQVSIGIVGAGNFTGQVLLPALKQSGARLKTIASNTGVSGSHLARKYGIESSTTNTNALLQDTDINTLVITTRHDSHARLVMEALKAGKRVYVEKPLCITREELERIETLYASLENPFLMVGFNRRFAPQITQMRTLLAPISEVKTCIMTVNAGTIPLEHWTQDPAVGGGRIIGEGCHFIDTLRYLIGHPIIDVQAKIVGHTNRRLSEDKMTLTLGFADGSHGTVHYFANGSKSFAKERLEVFCGGRILQLDNYRRLTGFDWPGFKDMNLRRQDKGHTAEIASLVEAVREGKPSPIPFAEIVEVMQATLRSVEVAL